MIIVGLALAELPPPDYRDRLMAAAAEDVALAAQRVGVAEAEAFADRWDRQVGKDARVRYEVGLAWRVAGDTTRARAAYDESIRRDPSLVAAYYDRGEIELIDGALDDAERDFQACARLAEDQWAGWFRLADVAARRGDATAFEHNLFEAMRRGFRVEAVVGDAHWRSFLADEHLGAVLRRLVTVYGDEAVLDELADPGAPTP